MKRVVKAVVAGAVGGVLVLGATQGANGASPVATYQFEDQLTDLQTTTAGPFDGAGALMKLVEAPNGTSSFVLRVKGIDPSVAGEEFGAHLHLGVCRAGDPDAALGHYNTDKLAGISPAEVSPPTEVWFDLVPDADGVAVDQTLVPFITDRGVSGKWSVVIHMEATNDATGGAGLRQACLPLVFS